MVNKNIIINNIDIYDCDISSIMLRTFSRTHRYGRRYYFVASDKRDGFCYHCSHLNNRSNNNTELSSHNLIKQNILLNDETKKYIQEEIKKQIGQLSCRSNKH